jgi:predicted transport protein
MNAIRMHRDQNGDDRCWEDDVTLYKKLPEGYKAPVEDTKVQLEMCQKYIACRHNPNTVYVSPQRRIEQLEAEVVDLQKKLRDSVNYWEKRSRKP